MKNKPEPNKINVSPWRHRLTWLTIVIQGAFPVACAVTPALAVARQHFLTRPADAVAVRTQVYTLSQAETVESVAKKFNMSVETLRKLNQLRTFAHGFDRLQPGDELDVPLSPLPQVLWHSSDDGQSLKAASVAVQAGSSLDHNGSGAASAAASLVADEAGEQAQQWLSRFGTARIRLDADKNFSLKNSQFDLLLPLSDSRDRLIFTQGSLHRTDERNQANLGLGIRHFGQGFMTGANAFFDYDLSRQHARSGMGVEYWRDFIKVAANGYVRLTSWKDARDFSDYEARPANGWDIRTDAFLPTLPQLGAKFAYEQYYGNDVALFTRDNRQKNPHAITAGVTFTPFPLLSLEAEQRQGKADEHDTRLGLTLNYQLGMPWRKQLDSEAVAAMRSLTDNRYDLVNRNNNIVLEYRKEDTIKLSTAKVINGTAGEQKTLNVSVSSKYGLDHISWSASSLLANGGKIIANGPGDFSVVLPAYHAEATGSNSYTLSGVAIDKKGNVSKRADTQVIVTEAAISLNNSRLTPTSSTLPADGHSRQTLTLLVKDGQGNFIDLSEKELGVVKNSRANGAQITAFTRESAGRYTATVTAGSQPEIFTVTPVARNIILPSATINIVAGRGDIRLSDLLVASDNATADGKDRDRVKAIVTDARGQVVQGETVFFTASHDASVLHSAVTDARGEAVATLTNLKSGISTVTARLGNNQSKKIDVNFSTAQTASLQLTPLINSGTADGKIKLKLKVSAKDANGNPVAGQVVTISPSDNRVQIPARVTLGKEGTAIVEATSNHAATYAIKATLNNLSSTAMLYFVAGPMNPPNSSFYVDKAVATVNSVVKVTFIARDQRNNHVSGYGLGFKIDGLAGARLSKVVESNGFYTAMLTSDRAGTVRVTATEDGKVVKGMESLRVTFTQAEQ